MSMTMSFKIQKCTTEVAFWNHAVDLCEKQAKFQK